MGWGSTIGGIGGAALGGYLGGPVGAMVGGSAGSYLGGQVGSGGLFSQSGSGPSDQERARQQQQQWLQSLQAAADGGVPSAADAQMRQGYDRLIAQQQSIAASNPGLSPAAAARMAAVNSASLGQGMVGQLALQRAQEQAQARAAYTDALNTMRQQDLGGQGQQLNYNSATRGQNMQIVGAGVGGIGAIGSSYLQSSGGRGYGGGSGSGYGSGGGSGSWNTGAASSPYTDPNAVFTYG